MFTIRVIDQNTGKPISGKKVQVFGVVAQGVNIRMMTERLILITTMAMERCMLVARSYMKAI